MSIRIKVGLAVFSTSLIVIILSGRMVHPWYGRNTFLTFCLVPFLLAFVIALPVLVKFPAAFKQRILLFLGTLGIAGMIMSLISFLHFDLVGGGSPHTTHYFAETPAWISWLVLGLICIPIPVTVSYFVLTRTHGWISLIVFLIYILFVLPLPFLPDSWCGPILAHRFAGKVAYRLSQYSKKLEARTTNAPREVVEDFLRVLQDGNFDKAEKYIGVDTIKVIIPLRIESFTKHDFVRWFAQFVQDRSVEDVKIEGPTALVSLTYKEGAIRLSLIKEGRRWKISGVEIG